MSPAAMTWTLKGLTGEFQGHTLELTLPHMTLGRTSQNHIVISDTNISRTHVTFFIKDDAIFIQDENSRNGTLINEKPIPPGTQVKLRHGDRILLGPHAFVLELEERNASGSFQQYSLANIREPGKNTLFSSTQKTQLQTKFKGFKLPPLNRRTLMYSVAGIVVLMMVFSQLPSKKQAKTRAPSSSEVTIQTDSSKKTTPMDEDELQALRTKARATLQFQDYLAATELYEKIVRTQPNDEYAKNQYQFAKDQLAKKIELHLENAKREFEKLNYERAIIEWKQVLALTLRTNPEIYKQTEEKIRDAEKELRKQK